MKIYSEYIFGDMLLSYLLDEEDRMSMRLIPADTKILRVMHSEGNRVESGDGRISVELKAPFEAIAVHPG